MVGTPPIWIYHFHVQSNHDHVGIMQSSITLSMHLLQIIPVMCFCIVLHYTCGNDFSVCKTEQYIHLKLIYIQHKEVYTQILQTYQFRKWCIKPSRLLMSWALLCMCCKEQLPLLFIGQKNKVWSCISVGDLGQIVCDGLLGFYIFINV